MKGLILISLFWVGYFTLHSLLATDLLKRRFHPQGYRIFYNTVSLLLLMALLFFMATTESVRVFEKNRVSDFLGLCLAAYGVIVIRLSFRQFSLAAFLGLRKSVEDEQFKTNGILEKVRHPIYSGIILLCLGFLLFIPTQVNLISVAWVFVYLPVGIRLEERKLIKKHGKDYEDYKARVPAVMPKIM